MKRAGVKRLRRNLAIALGNSGDPDAAAALADCQEPTASIRSWPNTSPGRSRNSVAKKLRNGARGTGRAS